MSRATPASWPRTSRGTIQTLTAYRSLISSLVSDHHGRVVDSPGDNLLAEFPNALDAVQCAVETQGVLRVRNQSLAENRQMLFRIGVHLGDVTAEGDRIYGDGVNIAARLEGLAEPGGICISSSVRDQVHNRLDLGLEDVGDQVVKNIADPVRVYRVLEAAPAQVTRGRPLSRQVGVGLVLGIAIALGVGFYLRQGDSFSSTTSPAGLVASHPLDGPRVAVLPLLVIGEDAADRHLGEGLAGELRYRLGSVPGLRIIGGGSSRQFGRDDDIQKVRQLLNVTHVVGGSVQAVGDRVRVSIELTSTEDGIQLWADRIDRRFENVLDLQETIASSIASALALRLSPLEAPARAVNREAWDLYLGAELDPLNLQATNALGIVLTRFRSPEAPEVYERLLKRSPEDPTFLLNATRANTRAGRLDEAAVLWDRVARLGNPTEVSSARAWWLYYRIPFARALGNDIEARALYEQLKRNEHANAMMLFQSATHVGELDSALRVLTRVIENHSAPIGILASPVMREAFTREPRYEALLEKVGIDRASIEALFPG